MNPYNRHRRFILWTRPIRFLSLAAVLIAPASAEKSDVDAAITELVAAGAIVKRFDVKAADADGQLVRFRAEHLDQSGHLEPRLLVAISRLPRVAVEFRNVPLVDDGLRELISKTRLIGLDLSGTRITNRGVEFLCQADSPQRDSLRLLNLCFSRMTDDGLRSIAHLKELRQVSLMECPITDTSLEALMKLPKLCEVYLAKTQVTVDAVRRWRRLAPQCRIDHEREGSESNRR